MIRRLLDILLLWIVITTLAMGQEFSIMTYNVENLFDTRHDSLKNDRDFLPTSTLHWTPSRFYKKVHNVMQVIAGVGKWEPPVLVGLCEIENDYVLKTMVRYEPYDRLGYDYIHYEGPDARGIDVALLYRKDMFNPISSTPIPVILPNGKPGREILYVCGMLNDEIMLHIFEVHFPSRREGAEFSEPNRIAAGKVVADAVDSIRAIDSRAGIIIMGDFNDNPSDIVPTEVLNAYPYTTEVYDDDKLYNLFHNGKRYEDRTYGSYYHQGEWDMLDQIMVSGSLLNGNAGIKINTPGKIYSPEWLSEWNEKEHKNVPHRMYAGPHYKGGVSDHYPIYFTFKIQDNPKTEK